MRWYVRSHGQTFSNGAVAVLDDGVKVWQLKPDGSYRHCMASADIAQLVQRGDWVEVDRLEVETRFGGPVPEVA